MSLCRDMKEKLSSEILQTASGSLCRCRSIGSYFRPAVILQILDGKALSGHFLQRRDAAEAASDLRTRAAVPEGSTAEVFTGQIPETLVRRLKLQQTSRESAEPPPPEERVRDLSCVDDVIGGICGILSSDLTETCTV